MRRFLTLKTLRPALALAAMLAVFVAGQLPASAHSTAVHHGEDFAIVTEDHPFGWVTDMERDGHYVCAEWRDDYRSYKQCDGGDPGGDQAGPFDFPQTMRDFRICEEHKGCSEWQDF